MAQRRSWPGVMEPEEDGDFVTLSCGMEQRRLGLGCWTAEIIVHTLETRHLSALCLCLLKSVSAVTGSGVSASKSS